MKYSGGQEVMLGDKVRLGEDDGGIVVCSIDRNEYSEHQPKVKWEYLKRGVVIDFPKFGLIHYKELEDDLSLIKRNE